MGGLSRGIRFEDIEIGKRKYNHHGNNIDIEYYIRQWKSTNDLTGYHPTGSHHVAKTFPQFVKILNKVVDERSKKY